MNKTTITSFAAIAAACFAGASAFAGTPVRTMKPSKPVAPPAAESCITGDIGLDVTSEYITKGIFVENQGGIYQPYANLHARFYKGTGLVTSVTGDIGIWESYQPHGPTPPAGSRVRTWFEQDFQTGLTIGMDKLSISPYFKLYQSPNDSFRSAYTTGAAVAYDDSDLLGIYALHPHMVVEFNLQGTTGIGAALGGTRSGGQYYEIGVAPAHALGPVTLTAPLTVGFGSGREYTGNRAFGFFSAGVDASYAMDFVPTCLGKWSAHAGFTYVRLGAGALLSTPGSFTSPAGEIIGVHDHYIVNGGIKVAF